MGTNRFKGKLVIDQQEQHYFTGSQCRAYLDGIYVTDINYIDYSIASNKAPIYSYNDPYYKVVARGNYIVQGNFTINFSDREKLVRISDKLTMLRPTPRTDDISISSLKGDNSLLKYFTSSNYDQDQMKDIISKYQTAYWGTNRKSRRYYRPDEWDLLNNGDIDPTGFDIVMVFGYPHGSSNQFAVKQINDVHIAGEAMVVADNGQPIAIQYQYFARSIDGESTIYQNENSDIDTKTDEDNLSKPIQDYDVTATWGTGYRPDGLWQAMVTFTAHDENIIIGGGKCNVTFMLGRNDSPGDYPTINTVTIPSGDNDVTITITSPTANTESMTIKDIQLSMSYREETGGYLSSGSYGNFNVTMVPINITRPIRSADGGIVPPRRQ